MQGEPIMGEWSIQIKQNKVTAKLELEKIQEYSFEADLIEDIKDSDKRIGEFKAVKYERGVESHTSLGSECKPESLKLVFRKKVNTTNEDF